MVEEIFLYLLESVFPSKYLHASWMAYPSQRMTKIRLLQFQLEEASTLINCYCLRQQGLSQDNNCLTRMNVGLGHWHTNLKLVSWPYYVVGENGVVMLQNKS